MIIKERNEELERSLIELLPWEIGKTYILKEEIIVEWNGKTLTLPIGFIFDRYTFAPNLKDSVPAAIHDCAYRRKKWDDGTPILRRDADNLLKNYMATSYDRLTRYFSYIYYIFVRLFGWTTW